MKLVTVEQMRALEAAAVAAGTSEAELMEAAGVAVAQETWINMGAVEGRTAIVLVGPGSNGGDGLVAAVSLREWGAESAVYLVGDRPADDPLLQRVVDAEIEVLSIADDPGCEQLIQAMRGAQGIVDALLGTGLNRPIDGPIKEVLDRLADARADRTLRPHLVAIDVPSGVNPDTGAADPAVVRADTTVALGFAKVGLFAMPARAIAGTIAPVEIGLPADAEEGLPYEEIRMRDLQPLMPFRSDDAHKGTFGTAVVAAGSKFYPGAARLASESALRAGAGLVVLAAPESIQPLFAGMSPEITHHPLPGSGGADGDSAAELLGALEGREALLIGPGLTNSPGTVELVRGVLEGLDDAEGLRAAVIDADALNALAEIPDWYEGLALPRVLTPHPCEMARLLGTSVDEVQSDRLSHATQYAQRTGSIVVLKGAGTIVAHPDGRARLSEFASAVLATAGTGDVLAGFIVSLIAQGMDPYDAAATGVYLHTECGRQLESAVGPATAIAQDLLRALPDTRKALDG
ncbi:MAG: NAD(P)H-hydrate dehydratase [Chloroflexi bacterium]|nr:NAD(P)H-hydrate dehydratase [Chloroflexota bacterium]